MDKRRSKSKIVVILGPTATGKSALAVSLAQKFNGEVISADSRQVYRGLDIGTGKIKKKEMHGIPHHLLDVASPKKQYSAMDYKIAGKKVLDNIISREKIPIIGGGTGFYIDTLVRGSVFPDVGPNEKLRKELSEKSPNELFTMLEKLDPKRAKTVDRKNPRRLIRAIEVAKALGTVPTLERKSSRFNALLIGLTVPKEELREKINKRIRERFSQGMIAEAQKLNRKGLSWRRMEELGLEYRFLAQHLQGKISKDETIKHLETEIWHYAKRQITWFKRDKQIIWFHPSESKKILLTVKKFLIEKPASRKARRA